jgi:hypothetical protein
LAGPRDHPRAPEQADQPPRSGDRPGQPDQPRVPDSPARADRPDTPSPAGREPRRDRPASPEDERRMRALEAFPPGHPSSPYQADGSRRPAEPSLRSLELPIPDEIAEEWGLIPSGGRGKDAGGGHENSPGDGGDRPTWGGDTGRGDWNGDGSTGRHAGGADEGATKADGPRWSSPELTEETYGQAEEFGDAFIPEEPRGQRGTADNTVGRSRDDDAQTADAVPSPEVTHRYYWTEVPRFKQMWSDHESAWPKETQPAAKIDRSGDPQAPGAATATCS